MSVSWDPNLWRLRGQTVLIGLAGSALFILLGLPLPWLLGPMSACLLAALGGVQLAASDRLGTLMRTVLGVAIGASITTDVVGRLPDMAASIALMPLFLLAAGAVGYPYFRRLCGFDPATSYYGAMPGGLQDMLVFGQEAGGDIRALSLIHATRVLVIVFVLPWFLVLAFGLSLDQPPGVPARDLPVRDLILMVIIAIAGWRGAAAIGLFGASVLGPMILAAIASLSGILQDRPPVEALVVALFFIGISVGERYVGLTWTELRRIVLAALGYTVLLGLLSIVFMEIVILFGLAPPVEAILAFAPGGQAEMAMIALVAGVDVAYVIVHHLVRLVLVILGAPLIGALHRP